MRMSRIKSLSAYRTVCLVNPQSECNCVAARLKLIAPLIKAQFRYSISCRCRQKEMEIEIGTRQFRELAGKSKQNRDTRWLTKHCIMRCETMKVPKSWRLYLSYSPLFCSLHLSVSRIEGCLLSWNPQNERAVQKSEQVFHKRQSKDTKHK